MKLGYVLPQTFRVLVELRADRARERTRVFAVDVLLVGAQMVAPREPLPALVALVCRSAASARRRHSARFQRPLYRQP